MKEAQKRLEDVSKGARGTDDMNSVCYEMGYLQALRDVDRKLKMGRMELLEGSA